MTGAAEIKLVKRLSGGKLNGGYRYKHTHTNYMRVEGASGPGGPRRRRDLDPALRARGRTLSQLIRIIWRREERP